MTQRIAVADIGGTHARFALAEVADGRVEVLGDPVTFKSDDYTCFDAAWQHFGRAAGVELPDALAMAFAGPVGGEQLNLTNSPWVIRPGQFREMLGIIQCKIVNDFGAVAHAVAQFGEDRFDHICGPQGPLPTIGVTSVIGPGTGLGVAQLIKAQAGYHVIETEGGHIDFAPLDELEDRILACLRGRFGRVSVERVASGSGLANLYGALTSIDGQCRPACDNQAVWAAALGGSDPLATAALDRFFLTLGAVAGDIALVHGANAVVIAGGLGYRLRDRFVTSGFSDRYTSKGRFERRMEAIPVKLLNHPQPGLYGAAAAFAQEFA